MRYTLLQLTQDILSSMDSDEVNSITDTVESMQVVKVIKTVYDDLMSRTDIVKNKVPFNLVASTDNLKPVLMYKPDNIDRVLFIRYNKIEDGMTDPVWADMIYLPFHEFMERSQMLSLNESYVESFDHTVDGFTFTIHYRNDTGPSYYTSFDDVTLIFDAHDALVDDTLQSIKTMCYGNKTTEWTEADGFVPNLQPEQFALLLNEAKSLAWAELKQSAHGKADQTARRNWRHIQKVRQQIPDGSVFTSNAHAFTKLPDFARRPR